MQNSHTSLLKKTPLYNKHTEARAKIVNFSGWLLPREYISIIQEAKATRSSCALFDVSHMGRILVKGKNALDFLQKLTTNNVASLKPYRLQYNLFINEKGTILDDFILYRLKQAFLLVVNATNKDKILAWLKEHKISEIEIEDISSATALLSLQGPLSSFLLERIFKLSLDELDYMSFLVQKEENSLSILSRSGYTGEDGFELIWPKKRVTQLWDRIVDEGRNWHLHLAGLGARDILRIEAGYPLYGNDIDETTNPWEASLGWVVKLKAKDFVGKETLIKIKEEGIKRRRVGILMLEGGLPRKGYLLCNEVGKPIGRISSGTYSPNKEQFIGMGYVNINFAQENTSLKVEIRNRLLKAVVKKLGFIRHIKPTSL